MTPYPLKVVRQLRGTGQSSPDDLFCVVTESPLKESRGYSFNATPALPEAGAFAALRSAGTSASDAERLIRQARAAYRRR